MTTPAVSRPLRQSAPASSHLLWTFALLMGGSLSFLSFQMATNPGENLVLASAEITENEPGTRTVTGIIENRTDRPFAVVRVEFDVFASGDIFIGRTTAFAPSIAARSKWKFNAPLNNATGIRVAGRVYAPENTRIQWLGACATAIC